MTTPTDIRDSVAEAYTRAVNTPKPQGSTCCQPVQKGVVVKSAGYTAEELAALPADAVENSFGCGNPLAFSEVKPGDTVLDLGSGAGIDLLIAAKKVGSAGRVIGIDMTDDMIERARANLAAAGVTHAEVRKGLIEQMPVDDHSVDWVISNCVINLSPEKPKVFAEIARVLKPGGKMLVSDIVAEELPESVRVDERLYCSCVAGAIGEDAYLQGLRDAGLVNVAVRERIVYDEAQLEGFIMSELPQSAQGSCCCGDTCAPTPDSSASTPEAAAPAPDGFASTPASAAELAKTMLSKIWSAKVYAEKPA